MSLLSSLPTFDLRRVPFSRAGSWLDLSPVVGEGDVRDAVHLVSHTGGMHGVLAVRPVRAGADVATDLGADLVADPSALEWRAGDDRLTAVFADRRTVLLRGEGLGVRLTAADATLTPFTGSYLVEDPVTATVVLTSYETGRRYRVGVERGVLEVEGAQRPGSCRREVRVAVDADGVCQLWVQELEGSAPRPEPRDLAEVREEVAAEYAAHLDAIAPWRSAATPAVPMAAYVMWSATVEPAGFVGSTAVLMSKHWMDKVWSWDHCFNALALAAGSPELAWAQLRLPFAHQDAEGALPDSVAHSEVLRNFVKPPIHGWALLGLLDRLPTPPDPALLRAAYDEVARWTTWWSTWRTVPERGLPHYQHGNDSGWDNATVFAEEQLLETADLAAFLAVQMAALGDVADRLDLGPEADAWRARADALVAALLAHLWTGTELVSHAVASGERRPTRSLLPKLALLLGDRLPAQVRETLVEQLRGHLTEHGLATEPVTSPDHERDGYWRGPIWAPSTVLAVAGLRACGHDALADDVADRFLRLCEAHGFAENFDAVTGAGLRDLAYTWTASGYLLLAEERTVRTTSA